MSVEEILYKIESEVMAVISEALKGGDQEILIWQTKKLLETQRVTDKTKKILKKYWKYMPEAVTDEISKAVISNAQTIDTALGGSGLLPKASEAFTEQLIGWTSSAFSELNLVNQGILEASSSVYTATVNKTVVKVLGGFQSLDTALSQTVHEWAKVGLPTITDKADRVWTAEGYGRMIIRTNVRRATTEAQIQRTTQHGVDLVEVSSHADARPLCQPYQGRIYSLSGSNKDYPALSSTSYGEAAGLFGINCTHTMYPFIEGVSTKTFDEYPKQESENLYKESQTQRRLERSIRNTKREITQFKNAGLETDQLNKLLNKRTERLKTFLNDTDRKRRYGREQTYL